MKVGTPLAVRAVLVPGIGAAPLKDWRLDADDGVDAKDKPGDDG